MAAGMAATMLSATVPHEHSSTTCNAAALALPLCLSVCSQLQA
jgi:hypothetical protein